MHGKYLSEEGMEGFGLRINSAKKCFFAACGLSTEQCRLVVIKGTLFWYLIWPLMTIPS